MVERVNYDAQVNQIPVPYYYPTSQGTSKMRVLGSTIAGGMIGMLGYYIPVTKDTFVQRGFDMKRDDNFAKIKRLKTIATEVENNCTSTESKMILRDMGVAEDVAAITDKCSELYKEVTETASVKKIKNSFITSFDSFKKETFNMDAQASDAFRAVKNNRFKWGVGIGAGIGLALGLRNSQN